MSSRTKLAALKNMIAEADQILATTPELPENRTARCRELPKSALAFTDDLIKRAKMTSARWQLAVKPMAAVPITSGRLPPFST